MAVLEHNIDDLSLLLAALCDGMIEADDFASLEHRLENDPAARLRYIAYLDLHGELCWDNHKHADIGANTATIGEEYIAPPADLSFPMIKVDELGAVYPRDASLFGVSSGWVLPYIVATVTIVAMLLGAWAYKINRYQHIATNDAPSNTQFKPQFVGRITGMKDCVWADGNPGTIIGAAVPFDRKYILSSGLLEIAYTSGARVILEGPCDYTVDSDFGGRLLLGKLIARVDKKVASGQWPVVSKERTITRGRRVKSEPLATNSTPNPRPPVPLFRVTTPTAVVTDLGTEFGVEVDEDGTTESHVIQGVIDVRAIAFTSGESPHYRVEKGHAVCVDSSGKTTNVLFASNRFVRQLTDLHETPVDMEYVNAVLADKPLGYWPLNEPAHSRKYFDRSGNGFHGWAIGDVRPGQPGPLSLGSKSTAMDGDGYIYVGRQDRFALANGFTIEAWILPDESDNPMRIISADNSATADSRLRTGWSLAYSSRPHRQFHNTSPCLVVTAFEVKDAVFENLPRPSAEWMHIVLIIDRSNTARLYMNARKQSSVEIGSPVLVNSAWLSIGATSSREHLWRGRLAQVAIYPHELSEHRINEHYRFASGANRESSGEEEQSMDQ